VATLNFGTTDRKVFTPVSTALANLPNGAGTIIALIHKSTTGVADFCGLTNSAQTNWYHGLEQSAAGALSDDDGLAFFQSGSLITDDTTNWYWHAVDWASGAASIEAFHTRNHTSGGAWSHSNAGANNGGTRAGPGTGGWMRLGFVGDFSTGTKDMALVAVWAGTRFSTSDYATWTKTSDLYSHPLGAPDVPVRVQREHARRPDRRVDVQLGQLDRHDAHGRRPADLHVRRCRRCRCGADTRSAQVPARRLRRNEL
jgi:hypothetical protein